MRANGRTGRAIGAAGAALVLAGCGSRAEARPPGGADPPAASGERGVVGIGRVEPATGRVIVLGVEGGGQVLRVPVQIGDTLRPGDVVIELDAAVERRRLAEAEAARREAVADAQVARTAHQAAEPAVQLANAQWARARALAARGGLAPAELESARSDAHTRAALLEQRAAEIEAAVSRVGRAAAAEALVRTQLDRRVVRAPAACVVLSVDVRPGEVLAAGGAAAVAQVAPLGPLEVMAEIDEGLAAAVAPGQRAVVSPIGGAGVPATVVRAAPGLRRKSMLRDAGGEPEDRRVREVHLRLNPDARLLVGSRVEVWIRMDT